MTIIKNREIAFKKELFGKLPDRPLHLSVKTTALNESLSGGKLIHKNFEMELDFGNAVDTLPFSMVIPNLSKPCPVIILISETKDFYSTAKAWTNKGYAVLSLYYRDISENNSNFKSGLSAYISPSRRKKSSAGKIAVWAWAAIRAIECAEVLDEIDTDCIGVFGVGIFAFSAALAASYNESVNLVIPESLPEITPKFIAENPHLFSPECIKNGAI